MDNAQQGGAGHTIGIGAQRRRPVSGRAAVAVVLITVELLREVAVSATVWRDYSLLHDYINGAATYADLEAADADALTAVSSTTAIFVVWAAAGVAFLVWLWRARINAESMGGRDSQRRSRGWVVGSWTTPVVNLWYPYQVVSDIWQASAPRRPVSGTLVKAWWVFFVLAGLVKPFQWRMADPAHWESEKDVVSAANVTSLLTVLLLVAGVLLVLVIRQVTTWQNRAPGTAGGGR
ncbi:DUF4328 domain-containing protein [Kitasatospora sp. NPDC086801]|uniref:DUF4328 domain-containing protein n=1 Tax=Kitasatospora sp. NPDC086801 TaxID=3364066 RepID=UPI003804C6BA